jgi:heptaprenyl diphosphate synthase
MNNYWDRYPAIKRELEAVKQVMEKSVKSSEKTMETALLELMHSGGKMLRPAFVLLGGKFGKVDSRNLCNLAAVIEMLHMATLIHDDIVDNAETRRGSLTAQARYGKNYAVFMGDYLFSKCFMLLSNNTSMENMRSVSKVISTICAGEIEQYSSHYSINVSTGRYLRRIRAKTAVLFALSLYVGSREGGCSDKLSRQLGRIGYNIGMAFQIMDDILDFTGDEKVVGKPLGNDIKQGIFTIPLIYALQKDDWEIKEILSKKSYSENDIKELIEMTKNLGGIEKTRNLANKYTNKAFKGISSLPDCESKEILLELANELLTRKY